MAESSDSGLISLLQEQLNLQREQMQQQQAQALQAQEQMQQQMQQQQAQAQQQMEVLVNALKVKEEATQRSVSIPTFDAFDSTAELWCDYLSRFETFVRAHSIPESRVAQVLLTNQSRAVYKLLENMASQLTPPTSANNLSLADIAEIMGDQFNPKRFVVRERYNFWSSMDRKPGETIQELAARIRQDAVTCHFPAIDDPLDEAMRTRFMCSVKNESVLKSLFKMKDDELTFARAIEIAMQTEDAARVAKDTASGQHLPTVHKIQGPRRGHNNAQYPTAPTAKKSKGQNKKATQHTCKPSCFRCGKSNHKEEECFHKSSTCNYCNKTGHIEPACRQKNRAESVHKTLKIKRVNTLRSTKHLRQSLKVEGQIFSFEVDTGAADNYLTESVWEQLGKPKMSTCDAQYESASKHQLPVLGMIHSKTSVASKTSVPTNEVSLKFVVTSVPDLNIIGCDAIHQLKISVDSLLGTTFDTTCSTCTSDVHAVSESTSDDRSLQQMCQQVCQEFPEIFKPEMGCITDLELEVKFKSDAQPRFCKPRPVPFAVQDELNQAFDDGIAKGIWEPVQFNAHGTPVVPIRKKPLTGQEKGKLRVCGDYSVFINSQLETNRHPLPLPEDLMRKLGGGYGFSKIDLASAYNQVMLGPDSQKRLALSTHRGVLLQKRLPFGISSAPGYFQGIMEQLIGDLPGVAVYLDDILVSGTDAASHISNLRQLLQRLQERGVRCNKDKCLFAQPAVEYLGHILSRRGVAKSHKADAVVAMPEPRDVPELRSFLGSVNFYRKFLPNLATVTEPLHRLTRKDTPWKWTAEEQGAFQQLKEMLSADTVLAHFDPSLPVGIACDASQVGIGAVLFHRWADGSERPIANASKSLNRAQRHYSQIQKEALAIIFALKKFHQFLYGRKFTLITDHKPLLSLFSPSKEIPVMAANRLARWALMLSQYEYEIEYRNTTEHGNADVLSRLPAGDDLQFDQEEGGDETDTVCTIKTISLQVSPTQPGVLLKATKQDPVTAKVLRCVQEGWPNDDKDVLPQHREEYRALKKHADHLSITDGCLVYGTRVVIPSSLQSQVLQILHLGHFGMQRMKQLARTAVYWPRIDDDIAQTCRRCTACAEHQNCPPKLPNHPWMLPEKPWSRVHVDHAINFLGNHWLVMVDAYTKYPCIYSTKSVSTRSTTALLEEAFSHFGYPHAIVSDNATTFTSDEFKEYCRQRGITHLTGAPYHPATNGAAERLVQTFKKALTKSSLPPQQALLEFLQQYRRTPSATGHSPSELLMGRQIRTKIDTLLPSPVQAAQRLQVEARDRTNRTTQKKEPAEYHVGTPCYALYCGPRKSKDPRWVPAVVTKLFGRRAASVRISPRGPVWRRHLEQLRPRHTASEEESDDTTDYGPASTTPNDLESTSNSVTPSSSPASDRISSPASDRPQVELSPAANQPGEDRTLPIEQSSPTYGPGNPRRSQRPHKPLIRLNL